jgi:hypothetical protein
LNPQRDGELNLTPPAGMPCGLKPGRSVRQSLELRGFHRSGHRTFTRRICCAQRVHRVHRTNHTRHAHRTHRADGRSRPTPIEGARIPFHSPDSMMTSLSTAQGESTPRPEPSANPAQIYMKIPALQQIVWARWERGGDRTQAFSRGVRPHRTPLEGMQSQDSQRPADAITSRTSVSRSAGANGFGMKR